MCTRRLAIVLQCSLIMALTVNTGPEIINIGPDEQIKASSPG